MNSLLYIYLFLSRFSPREEYFPRYSFMDFKLHKKKKKKCLDDIFLEYILLNIIIGSFSL